ncbi:MAG: tetratricopeptide repeat protein [Thermoguttaceae bacterium]
MPARDAKKHALAACLFLLLAVVAVFGRTVPYEFVNYDDNFLICENERVKTGLTFENIGWAMTASQNCQWGPLTWLSYQVDSELFGARPWGYHLTNVALHAATTLILFLVLWRMTGDLWPSALAGLLFAIHPLRVEAVAWISERKGLLCGLFFVLTLAAYLRYVRLPFSIRRYGAVLLLFAASLLAKPATVMLPFLLLLLDYWPLGRMGGAQQERPDNRKWARKSDLRGLVIEKLPFAVLAIASCGVAALTQDKAIVGLEHVSLPFRIANALAAYGAYLWRFIWPVGLAAPYPLPESPPTWQAAVALFALAAFSVGALACLRRRPAVFVGWFWYVAMLAPVSGLVQLGSHASADRYTYLPQIGICIAVSWGVMTVARRRVGVAALALAATVFAGVAWHQTAYWRNSGALWRRALDCTSRNWVAHVSLGVYLSEKGDFAGAVAEYRDALEVNPNDAMTRNNLGLTLAKEKRFDEAIEHYQAALKIDPSAVKTHLNLAGALLAQGKLDAAIDCFTAALRISPNDADVHSNLGLALLTQGNARDAISHCRTALQLNSGHARASFILGVALTKTEQLEEARECFQRAATLARRQNEDGLSKKAMACAQALEKKISHPEQRSDDRRGVDRKATN